MDPLPPINEVYSILIQEERQRSVGYSSVVHIDSTALVVKGSNTSGSNPNSYFSSFNYSRNSDFSRGKNSRGKDRPIYTHCGMLGHVMEICFKLHGFPPGFKPKGKTSVVNQVNV